MRSRSHCPLPIAVAPPAWSTGKSKLGISVQLPGHGHGHGGDLKQLGQTRKESVTPSAECDEGASFSLASEFCTSLCAWDDTSGVSGPQYLLSCDETTDGVYDTAFQSPVYIPDTGWLFSDEVTPYGDLQLGTNCREVWEVEVGEAIDERGRRGLGACNCRVFCLDREPGLILHSWMVSFINCSKRVHASLPKTSACAGVLLGSREAD